MLWPKLPLLKLLFALLLGILLADLFQQTLSWLYGVLSVLSLVLFFLFLKKSRRKFLSSLSLHLIFLLLGSFIYLIQNQKDQSFEVEGTENAYLVEVSRVLSPTSFYKRYLVKLDYLRIGERWQKVDGLVLLKEGLSEGKEYLPDDQLFLSGQLSRIPEVSNPFQFDYSEYLKYQHVLYQIRTEVSQKLDAESTLRREAFKLRSKLINAFQHSAISAENLSIFMAILLGDKSELDTQLRNDFSRAGAMHILAVSGLHLGIVFLLFDQLLQLLRLNPKSWLRVLLLTSILWGFALLTGMSNSVMRSALMFSFLIAADLLDRKGVGLNSVAASALILLLMDPFRLFQVGFQLSYSAVFGILTMFPILSKLFRSRYKLINKFLDLMLISVAAQLSTLPLTLAYFHQFPNLFLFSNLLVVPLAFTIVGGGVLLSTVYLISGSMWGIDRLIELLIDLLRRIVASISEINWSATTDIWLHNSSLILLTAMLIMLITYLHSRRSIYFLISLTLLGTIFFVEDLELIYQSNHNQFTIYSMRPPKMISIKRGLSTTLIQMDSSSKYESQIVRDHLSAMQVRKVDTLNLQSTFEKGYPLLKYAEDRFLIQQVYEPIDDSVFNGSYIIRQTIWNKEDLKKGNQLIVCSFLDSLGNEQLHNLADSIFQLK